VVVVILVVAAAAAAVPAGHGKIAKVKSPGENRGFLLFLFVC